MRRFSIFACMILLVGTVLAQSQSFDEWRRQQMEEFNSFKSEQQAEYDAFRKQVNEEYADFMKQMWKEYKGEEAEEPVKEKEVKPVMMEEVPANEVPKQDQQLAQDDQKQEEERKQEHIEVIKVPIGTFTPKPIPVQQEVAIVPKPEPAPEPIAPVVPSEKKPYKKAAISFYGTLVSVGFPDPDNFKLKALKEEALAEAWKELSDEKYDVTVSNAIAVRGNLKLCDWAYMNFLQAITEKHYGKTNEAVFMQAFLMTQSGYKVRLAFSKSQPKLYMLFGCRYDIYQMTYYRVDGLKFYAYNCDVKDLCICPAAVEKEKALSLQIAYDQKFDKSLTQQRTLTSKKGVTCNIAVNKNNIDFFNTYPSAYVSGDQTTRWAAYANTPLEKNVRDALYPQLKAKLEGLSEKDAVGLLLNWVQTAFVYEYDDKVWGHDRVFFAAETLYYPYCDCEDRAILFSRLVRDLVGSKVVLLYYPGHLAAAVSFKDQVNGDYLIYDNKKYIVCDPTYINAGVGRTMPGMDNQNAKVIVLL